MKLYKDKATEVAAKKENLLLCWWGYNTERQSLAEEVITKYWTKLDKPSLLGDLLHHAPFEIFKKYFTKARLKPDQTKWFLVSILKHDNVEEVKWIMEQKKFDSWLDEKKPRFLRWNVRE